jgi:ubiquinone/menaquinone biosynthesis C-methylase UbiE
MSEKSRSEFPSEITRFYQSGAEGGRLASGPGKLEFARTQEIARRYLPDPPANVLDVGGAWGDYSLWLAAEGYRAHLVDIVPRHVDEARRRSEASPHPIHSCQVGDARHLPLEDGAADAVLLLGPLYHLTQAPDRERALREANRVLRPGGVMLAAGISRYASALDGVARDLFEDPHFTKIMEQDLRSGQHRNETEKPDYFTTAFFHRPDELQSEVESAGFRCEGVFGLEGPCWMLADFDERWAEPRRRENLLRVARALEREPSVVGVSAHLLAVGIKG